jgi:hypothetical protein
MQQLEVPRCEPCHRAVLRHQPQQVLPLPCLFAKHSVCILCYDGTSALPVLQFKV